MWSDMKNYPSVTIEMLSYNDEKIITDCFKSIRVQDYPAKVQILLVDGGSTDKTVQIAKKYKAKVISRPDLKNNPAKRGEIWTKFVETDIAIVFSADNRFQEKTCLRQMMEPFFDPEISAVETFRYGFRNNNSLLTKYFALIGGTDPVAVALGKADRAPYDKDSWHSFGKVESNKNYFKIIFDKDPAKIPTLGANGFAVRNSLLKKIPNINSLHTDVCVNMIRSGYNKFAFIIKGHVIHSIDSNVNFLRRKINWLSIYSPNKFKRKHLVYNPKTDFLTLIIIIFSFATFIFPLIRAVKGYIKYRHPAWFLHPVMCFVFLVNYGLGVIKRLFF